MLEPVVCRLRAHVHKSDAPLGWFENLKGLVNDINLDGRHHHLIPALLVAAEDLVVHGNLIQPERYLLLDFVLYNLGDFIFWDGGKGAAAGKDGLARDPENDLAHRSPNLLEDTLDSFGPQGLPGRLVQRRIRVEFLLDKPRQSVARLGLGHFTQAHCACANIQD